MAHNQNLPRIDVRGVWRGEDAALDQFCEIMAKHFNYESKAFARAYCWTLEAVLEAEARCTGPIDTFGAQKLSDFLP